MKVNTNTSDAAYIQRIKPATWGLKPSPTRDEGDVQSLPLSRDGNQLLSRIIKSGASTIDRRRRACYRDTLAARKGKTTVENIRGCHPDFLFMLMSASSWSILTREPWGLWWCNDTSPPPPSAKQVLPIGFLRQRQGGQRGKEKKAMTTMVSPCHLHGETRAKCSG
jgi:hypothetical protein